MDAEGVDSADALDLYQVALDAGHHCPDVAEGDEGEEEAPDDCQRDAQDGREQPVAPVLADGEGGVAGFPDTVKAVCSHRLSYHILKVHLGGEKTEVRGAWGGYKGSRARVRICCNVRGEPEWRGLGRTRAVLGRTAPLHPPEQGQAPVQLESPCPGRGQSGRRYGAPGTACSQPMGSAVRGLNPRHETPGLAAPGHVPWS